MTPGKIEIGASRLRRRLKPLFLAVGLLLLGLWGLGCYEGLPPTMVIPTPGPQQSYLPMDFSPGTRVEQGLIYFYDQSQYAEYKNEGGRNQIPAGTDDFYIKRGSVLSIIGASTTQIQWPDLVDDTLAAVYGNPDLFGFQAATDREPGFYEGAIVPNTNEFMPDCLVSGSCGPTWYSYNHVQFQWARKDTLVGTTTSSTSGSATTWTVRSQNQVRDQLRDTYIPSYYEADWLWSVTPGSGIFMHGWTLTSERDNVIPEGTGSPVRQRNPVFLWLSQLSLGPTNTNEIEYTSLDQCLDAMWGEVLLHPIQLAGADFQEGERFVTWTYVGADSSEIRRRVDEGNTREQLRCSGSGVPPPPEVPMDSSAFPIYFFMLLARYEVTVERLYDVLQWRLGNNIVGLYGEPDGVIDVVKLKVLVNVVAPEEKVAQQVDLYLMRGIGLVVQQTGLDVFDISRLREATVDGTYYPPEFFNYADQ